MSEPISKSQLKRLQTLYSALEKRDLAPALAKVATPEWIAEQKRTVRVQWAVREIDRHINSFRELTRAEANALIDTLQAALGQAFAPPQKAKRRLRREAAHAAGTHGRRGVQPATLRLVAAADLARIDDALARLGWGRPQFDAWLRSPSSPLARKVNGTRIAPTNPQVRTQADANRVWWALKALLQRNGKWNAPKPANATETHATT